MEAGAVAAAFGDTASVVSGGLVCVAGALLLAGLLPAFRGQRADDPHPDDPHPADAPGALSRT